MPVSVVRERWLAWQAQGGIGMEVAGVALGGEDLRARGWALGTDPHPYAVSYELETGPEYVTRRLSVTVRGPAGSRALELRRERDGTWTADGSELPEVRGALDCDLARSPLTNTMPVLRHGLHARAGEVGFLMAWVSVPALEVHPSEQTYRFVRALPSGSVVHYQGSHRDVSVALELDPDGLVVDYPGLARRVQPPGPPASVR